MMISVDGNRVQIDISSIAHKTSIKWFVNGPSDPNGVIVCVGLQGGYNLIDDNALNFVFTNHDEAQYFSSDLARYLRHYHNDRGE